MDLDAAGKILSFNAAARRLLGEARTGAPGLPALAHQACSTWQLAIVAGPTGETVWRFTPMPSGELLAAASTGILARGITHDLNNLFTCILATASTAAHPVARDPRQYMDAIRQAVLRGAELLNLLRELTEESSGRPHANVLEVLEWCGLLLERVGAGVGVEVVVSSVDVEVALPARELQQIIVNLGLNAIEAMSASGGRLVLRAEARGDRVGLMIADTGPGIDAARLAVLFEAGTTKPGHSGVGLAVVRELVQRAGGSIHVDSAVGRGTEFTIDLPGPAEETL